MNLLGARVVLRPRSLADVLDLALPLTLRNRRPIGVLAVLLLGPIAGLAAFLRVREHWEWRWLWCLVVPASFLVEGVFTVAFGELLFRDATEVGPWMVVRRFGARLPAAVVTFIGRQLLLVVSTTLIVLPFIQGPRTLFAGEALWLEHASPGKALVRSRALASQREWFCLGLWLATLALPVVGAVVADQLGGALIGIVLQLGQPAGSLFSDGGSGFAVVGALLAAPVAAAARFLGYIDLRTRKEGWDLQLRFMVLASDRSPQQRRAA